MTPAPGAAPDPEAPGGVEAGSAPRPVDPVCGMPVDEPAATREHRGRRYAFCSPQCLRRFEEQPDRYVTE